MHPGLVDIAEWLGYEVIDVEGEAVVRHRVNGRGVWVEREMRATAAEQHLYDAVRGLAYSPQALEAAGLRVAARALGLDVHDGVSIRQVLDKIAATMTEARTLREAYERGAELVNQLREELLRAQENVQQLLAAPRFVPKGTDRNELARQVRSTAVRLLERHEENPDEVRLAIGMANTVLHLLHAEPIDATELP